MQHSPVKLSSVIQPTLLATACAVLAVATLAARSADDAPAARPAEVKPVQARPPLQAVPTTPLTKATQERMRQCNAQADKSKLQGERRETFVKGCMQPRRPSTPAQTSAAR